jgi:hypothetical protein
MAAAWSLDDLTAEPRPVSSETLNGRVEIGNDDLESILPSRLGNPAGFACATYAGLVESSRRSSFAKPANPGARGMST